MVDVRDPLKPKFAGCYAEDGYVHDAQCVIYHGPDTRYTGKEVCFCYNENSLTLVDVTDKSKPTMISKRGYTGYEYTHQVNFTPLALYVYYVYQGYYASEENMSRVTVCAVPIYDVAYLFTSL